MSQQPPVEGGGEQPPPPPPSAPQYPGASPPYPGSQYPQYPGAQYPAPSYAPVSTRRPGPAPGLEYAGFWLRFGGYLIDAVLLLIVELVVSIPFLIKPIVDFYRLHPIVQGQTPPTLPADLVGRFAIIGLLGAALSAVYYGGLVAWQGRTIGQRVIGARVVRVEDGGPLPEGRSFLRAAIWWAPGILGLLPVVGAVAGLLAFIGLLAVAWDPRKQGWHDKLGRSVVVRQAPGW